MRTKVLHSTTAQAVQMFLKAFPCPHTKPFVAHFLLQPLCGPSTSFGAGVCRNAAYSGGLLCRLLWSTAACSPFLLHGEGSLSHYAEGPANNWSAVLQCVPATHINFNKKRKPVPVHLRDARTGRR